MKTGIHWWLILIPFLACSCWAPGNRPIQSIDRSQPLPRAGMWRQIDGKPPSFVPKPWPKTVAATERNGKWLEDPQDKTRYFIPSATCGGLPPGTWQGEALKMMNSYSKEEQAKRNALTTVVGMPAEFFGRVTLEAMAASAGGTIVERPTEGLYLVNPEP